MSKEDEKLLNKGVAFDLDFTLINWNNIKNLIAGIEILQPVINQKHIRSEYRWTRQLPAQYLENLRYKLPQKIRVAEKIKRAMQQLEDKKICTALITDSTLDAEHSAMLECFDHIVITSRYGCSKPLNDSFYSLVAQTGVPISHWTYVGDNRYLDGNFALSCGATYLDIETIEELNKII